MFGRGVDCFGSRSAFLTSAEPQIPPDKKKGRFYVLAVPGDWLVPPGVFTSNRSSKAQDPATPGSREGQPGGVTCLCI